MAATARADWLAALKECADDLSRSVKRMASGRAQELDGLARRLQSPGAAIAHERTRLSGLQARLGYAIRMPLVSAHHALERHAARLRASMPDMRMQRANVQEVARRMHAGAIRDHQMQRQAVAALRTQLALLNPQRTLERGYAIVSDAHGTVLRNPKQLQPREPFTVQLAEGSAEVLLANVQASLE
jgi:exodeoxyribonuclease VII large subunit